MKKLYTILFLMVSVQLSAQFSGGSGTPSDPYQIANKADLDTLSSNSAYWDKHFVQTADIIFTSADFQPGGDFYNNGNGFIPIGNDVKKFSGSYDGQGHVIDSLYINRPSEDYVGFFGYVSTIDTITGLGLLNVTITGHSYVGGFCGHLTSLYNNVIVNNCYVTGIVNGTSGLIGGFCGKLFAHITQCYTNCTVLGGANYVGGFCGSNLSNITECYSEGTVIVSNNGNIGIGGFCGDNGDYIGNCYSTASVSVTPCSGCNSSFGGFCGFNGSIIENCYSVGAVTGNSSYMGGFCGLNYGLPPSNCYWDTITSGISVSDGGTGLPTSQMQNITTYTNAGWDFVGETANGNNDYWDIDNCLNNNYPYLSWSNVNTLPNSMTSATVYTAACDSYISPSGNYIWTATGIYKDTISNVAGCDSIITINLTITNSTSSTESTTVCDSYTWGANGQTYTTTGSYTTTLTNAAGCDSVVMLNLIVTHSNSGEEHISVCNSYVWSTTGQTYAASGTYTALLTNTAGCDSLVTLNLTVTVLAGDVNNDCIIGNGEIAGDINGNGQIDNGEIAGDVNGDGVIGPGEVTGDVNGNGIIDSNEVEGDANGNGILDSGEEVAASVKTLRELDIILHPNPTETSFTILSNEIILQVEVVSVDGKVINVMSGTGAKKQQIMISSEKWAPGMYFVKITSVSGETTVQKVLKK